MQARHQHSADQDLILDSAALSLHNFYAWLERIFTQIASTVDQSTPTGPDWHRELLRQMTVEVPAVRPPVLSAAVAGDVDEFLRFRHVVRNVYTFALDPERVERLASRLRPAWRDVRSALFTFASFLAGVAQDG